MSFSKKSKFAPRVKVDEDVIELKNSVFKPATSILWSDVKKIEFGPYKLNIQLAEQSLIFHYESSMDTSINIKSKILEVADKKNIDVVEG